MAKNRIISLDVVRAFCAIWIIAFWHFRDFFESKSFNELVLVTLNGEYITSGVLSCFMFLSGFFLRKYSFYCIEDLRFFIRKRFWRFYLLLILAALWMLLPKMQIVKLVCLLTGTSIFLNDQPQTLWFFGDLIFFYALTPFILWKSNNKRLPLIKSVILYFLIIVLYIQIGFNERVIMYMPFYLLGLLSNNNMVNKTHNIMTFCISNIILSILLFFNAEIHIFYQLIVPIELLSIGYLIEKYTLTFSKLLSYISYSSMCAYLFHKQIMGLFKYHICEIRGLGGGDIYNLPLCFLLLSTIIVR